MASYTELNFATSASDVLNVTTGGICMLLILALILLILWLAGVIAFHVTAWFIHLILVLAIIIAIIHLLRGRSAP